MDISHKISSLLDEATKTTTQNIRKEFLDELYLGMTILTSSMSRATRSKVGALIVNQGVVCSTGYNGTPRGTDNNCETYLNHTKDEVIHAEVNAILNMVISGSGANVKDATAYITYSPCIKCAAVLKQAGITRVVYMREYRLTEGVDYLKNNGVEVCHIPEQRVVATLLSVSISSIDQM